MAPTVKADNAGNGGGGDDGDGANGGDVEGGDDNDGDGDDGGNDSDGGDGLVVDPGSATHQLGNIGQIILTFGSRF